MVHVYETMVGDRTLTIETGKLAQQANGAVTIRYGEMIVLAAACAVAASLALGMQALRGHWWSR